ncbi:MAG: hypothetical protein AAFN70_05275, partial [Planctomycetota bacterium]
VAGPILLVLGAFLPRGLTWQQRVKLILPLIAGLIAGAIGLGAALDVPFDKVLLGIFLCWTPQSAIAAIGLSAWIMICEYRNPRDQRIGAE